jgi:FtsP/CotA-like multicopper oxidase with cupredoxin domain
MVTRREFLAVAGATAAGSALIKVATPSSLAALPRAKPDFTIRIAPVNLELAPATVIKTVGYNGKAPGPILRMREGKRVTVDIYNDSDSPELVHWHGQYVSPEVDGT